MLTGGAMGALTFGIGQFDAIGVVGKAILHGMVQGAFAESQGGDFLPAFAATAFSKIGTAALGAGLSIAGFSTDSFDGIVARGIGATVIGGTASAIGGGKFQNGAATGAFVYLFNELTKFGRKYGELYRIGDCEASQCTFSEKAGAFFSGAKSVFVGTGDAFRYLARGSGIMGAEEKERWDLEAKVVDRIAQEIASNATIRATTVDIVTHTTQELIKNNTDGYLKWYMFGRTLFGVQLSPMGPMATIGGATRAVERGHDFIDAMVYGGGLGK